MSIYLKLFSAISLAMCGLSTTCLASTNDLDLIRPVPGKILESFHIGSHNWEPGHRGIDLAAQPKDVVVAAAAGKVVFAGKISGVYSISIQHFPTKLRTTYTPVSPLVKQGDQVKTGQTIGFLLAGYPHSGTTCLHWGLKDDQNYYDPINFLVSPKDTGPIRLLPLDTDLSDFNYLNESQNPVKPPELTTYSSNHEYNFYPPTVTTEL